MVGWSQHWPRSSKGPGTAGRDFQQVFVLAEQINVMVSLHGSRYQRERKKVNRVIGKILHRMARILARIFGNGMEP